MSRINYKPEIKELVNIPTMYKFLNKNIFKGVDKKEDIITKFSKDTKTIYISDNIIAAVTEMSTSASLLQYASKLDYSDLPDTLYLTSSIFYISLYKHKIQGIEFFAGTERLVWENGDVLNFNVAMPIDGSVIDIDIPENSTKEERLGSHFSQFLLAAIIYIYFGNITSHFYTPKSKSKFGEKYNPTNSDITYVDTTWKMRINTDGFPVRGHFRLQSYKLKKSKLIWIEAFMKKGYNRKAGVELAKI